MENRNFYLVAPLVYTGSSGAFTYHAQDELSQGQIVHITIGRRRVIGVVTDKTDKPSFKTKSISEIVDISPVPSDLIALAEWMSSYYAASPSSVWSTLLPAGITKSRRETVPKRPLIANGPPKTELTEEQSNALKQVQTSAKKTALLQGVTGSGKTRIYMELASIAIAQNRSCIILVPEITLTPQIVGQFEEAFGSIVLASHSKLTESQRHKIWISAHAAHASSSPRIIIGPRSCLFMPAFNLGLIVIDESHESTYKQEQHPRYQAQTVAAKRAQLTDARLILGSATPGMQELFLAKMGKIEHVFLRKRANEIPHSQGIIIDLRNKELFKKSKFITQNLLDALAETLDSGRQSLLYLNRRGSASSQICSDCGYVSTCPNCHLPLTFHADLMRLICHHCNYRATSPAICPNCKSMQLRLLGGGTKRIEAEIVQLFPEAHIARLDRDSATIGHITSVFRDLRAGKIDIIVGTQMIAKGLDLPAIDTVGIVNADTMLHLPDYTAAERTYQLISQVSGRTGRGDRAGRVYIQTYTPDHPAIVSASTGEYDSFSTSELAERKALNYPPYVYLLKLTIAAPSREEAQTKGQELSRILQSKMGIAVIGPAPAFIESVSGKYHWILTVKCKHRAPLVRIAAALPSSLWTADLDPTNLL
jgi:primosomal protein N' (replication factor Y)